MSAVAAPLAAPFAAVLSASLLLASALAWADVSAAPTMARVVGAWSGALAGLYVGPDGQVLLDTQHWRVACRADSEICAKPRAQGRGRQVAWAVATAPQAAAKGKGASVDQWALLGSAGDPGRVGVSLVLQSRPASGVGRLWPAQRARLPSGPGGLAAMPGQALLLLQAQPGQGLLLVSTGAAAGQAPGLRPLSVGVPPGAQPERVGSVGGRWWVAGEARLATGEPQAWLALATPSQHWAWPPQVEAGRVYELSVVGVQALGKTLWAVGTRVQVQRSTQEAAPLPPTAWLARLDVDAPASSATPAPQAAPLPPGLLEWLGWLPGRDQPTLCGAVSAPAGAGTAARLHCATLDGPAWKPWPHSLPLAPGAQVQAAHADPQGGVWLALLANARTELVRWTPR